MAQSSNEQSSSHQQQLELLDIQSLTKAAYSSIESSPNLSFLHASVDYCRNSDSDFTFENFKNNTEDKSESQITTQNGGIVQSQPKLETEIGGPKIGRVSVQNASDITFGNKTFYQGPVTIKQIVMNKSGENEIRGML